MAILYHESYAELAAAGELFDSNARHYTAAMYRWLRYLRIAFTAICLIATVLLIGLWVRSYRYDRAIGLHGERAQHLNSQQNLITAWSKLGAIHFRVARPTNLGTEWNSHFAVPQTLGFGLLRDRSSSAVRIPYWFTMAVLGAVAIFPWTPLFSWRFSVRTMFVATTVIAVALGAIVYSTR